MSAIVVSATSGASDPYIILGYVSFTAFIQIFSSLLADLIVVGMDPRVSLGRK
jgi:oligopeptide transport system permease protein